MGQLTRPAVMVDPTSAKYMGEGLELETMNDALLDLILNGPTINGISKDTLRRLIRKLYGALQDYEYTGLPPQSVMEMKQYAHAMHEKLMVYQKAEEEGRLNIHPGKPRRTCGECGNFLCEEGKPQGSCKVRKFQLNRRGGLTGEEFRPYRSRTACSHDFVPKVEEPKDDWLKKRFFEVV